jgi:flagellar biosynthetic protein FliR
MTNVVQIGLPYFEQLLVIMGRVAGLVAALPVFGSRLVPVRIKAALVLALSLVLLPIVQVPALPKDPFAMAAGLGAEFLVGLVLGLGLRALFVGIELAGELMDHQMGLGMAQLFDPASFHQVSVIGQFQSILALLLMVTLDLPVALITALAKSFTLVVPFGAYPSASLVEDVVRILGGAFVVALKLAAPLTAVLLMVNLGLAVLGRAIPQLNVFMLGFPLTIGTGLLMLGVALPWIASCYQDELSRLGELADGLLRSLGHG